jgi:hypothetical protein
MGAPSVGVGVTGESNNGRGKGGGRGGGLSASAGVFLASCGLTSSVAHHFAKAAHGLLRGVIVGEKARKVFHVHLATPIDGGDIQEVAMARAGSVHVDPDIPPKGFVNDDRGEWPGLLPELALGDFGGGFDTKGRGTNRTGQFGRRKSL